MKTPEELLAMLNGLIDEGMAVLPRSRRLSLTLTNLEQAALWLASDIAHEKRIQVAKEEINAASQR